MPRKRPFDIHAVLRRIRAAVTEHADAAMFELAGHAPSTSSNAPLPPPR